MDLHKLRSFVCIVEQSSFSRASTLLRIAQPALSRQMKLLEEELGVTLLVRTGRGAVPTAAGEVLADHARRLMKAADDLHDAVRVAGTEPTGPLSLGVPSSLGLPLLPLLGQIFRRDYPKVRLHLVEGFSASIHEWILAGRLDMAILYETSSMGHLTSRPLLEESVVLVSQADGLAAGSKVGVDMLSRLPLALPARPHRLRLMVDGLAMAGGAAIEPVLEIDALPVLIEAVRLGHVHTVLPYSSVAAWVQRGELSVAGIDTPLATRRMTLARPTEKPLSPASRALEEQVIALVWQLAQSLGWQPLIKAEE